MTAPSPGAPPDRGGMAIPILLSIIFLNMIGTGVVIPLLPFYAKVFQAAPWQVTVMFSVFAAGQFLGELYWGRLSDRIGRRPVVIGTIFAAAVGYVCLALAPNIWVAILVRGVAGFFSGNNSTIQAYIVDASPPDKVAGRLGWSGSVLAVGFIVGPILGGLLSDERLGEAGFRPPLLVSAGLCVLAGCATLLFVRESRDTTAASAQRTGPLTALRRAAADPVISKLLATTFFAFGGFSSMWSIFGLWGAARFAWGPGEIGMAMALIGGVSAVSQGFLSGWCARRFGPVRTVICALSLGAVAMLVAAAGPPQLIAVAAVLAIVSAHTMAQPSIISMIARHAPTGQPGAILGANNATSAAARVVTPVMAGFVFSAVGPWAPFLLAAVSTLAGIYTAFRASRSIASAPLTDH